MVKNIYNNKFYSKIKCKKGEDTAIFERSQCPPDYEFYGYDTESGVECQNGQLVINACHDYFNDTITEPDKDGRCNNESYKIKTCQLPGYLRTKSGGSRIKQKRLTKQKRKTKRRATRRRRRKL